MAEYRFLDPIDVLYLRGNRLFGNAGAHGEALMPPWPSLAAGSLRSRMLVDNNCHPSAYGRGEISLCEPLSSVLGTPDSPGSFRICLFTLGRLIGEVVEPYFPLPADVVAHRQGSSLLASYVTPTEFELSVKCGYPLEQLPVLRTSGPFKSERGLWLNSKGLASYSAGRAITADHLVSGSDLWRLDTRLGIALDEGTRTATPGRIYTAETVALAQGVGFLVGIEGADGFVPKDGMLRFGGDGRSVRVKECQLDLSEPPWQRIQQEGRFRLMLTTPGVSKDGWIFPGCKNQGESWFLHGPGFSARFVTASMARYEVVSGWDIARLRPKTAVRVAPTSSVYWLDQLDGRIEGLQQLAREGLWMDGGSSDPVRRAEGFNNMLVAAWPAVSQ